MIAAAVAGFSGVGLGAFGAHALKERLPADLLAIYQTGVQYHLIHAVALLATAVLADGGVRPARLAGWMFVAGLVLFSGSLYTLSITGVRVLGAVTPLGGVCFLVGWAALGWAAFTRS